MKVELIDIEKLIPYAMNARTHSDTQVAQIAGSIKEFGFTNPVLIDADNGLIAGHGRVMAGRKLGLKEVPAIRLGHLTEVQKKAYILADNRIALNSGWDTELLKTELELLKEEDVDLEMLGFDEQELRFDDEVKPLDEMPALPNGDRMPIQQMAFILHDEQVEKVREAIEIAKNMGNFIDTGNENSNGNALARICELFITQNDIR
jgi:ParB-like chromosome segregation protein Spo0J